MKSSKAIPRAAKQSRMRSPMRKMHPSPRKSGPPRSPQRSSGSGRPMGPRPRSPSMKHGPPPPSRKHSHSPRRRSISPRRPAPHRTHGSPVMDRIHHSHKRSHELEKRRHHSRSPLSHRLSPREGPPREGLPTHPPDRYPGSRSREPPQDFDSSPKKKMHRENDRFVPDHSPPRIPLSRAPPRVRSEGHASHNRNEANIHQGTIHPSLPPDHRGRDFGPPRTSDRRDGSPFHIQDRSREGFCPPSPGMGNHRKGGIGSSEHGFPRENIERFRRGGEPPEEYMETGDKHYGPTLDERFRSFTGDASRNMESRIQYTREDLEKITIDIRRNIREPSPTVRRILNPSEVKLVRRPSEGNRPIFDREEIKQSPRDMREDAYFEQRVISVANFAGMNQYGVDHRELENYEITRHKFDNYGSLSSAGRSLSDRWQKLEGRKGEPSNLDRDERNHGFEGKSHVPDDFVDDGRHHRSRSLDRDLRQERFHPGVEVPHRRPEYPDFHRPLPNDPADLRHSLAVRRKDSSLQDARQRILERRGSDRDRPPELRGEPRGQWNPVQERRLSESGSDRPRVRRSSSRGPRLDSPRWDHDRESDRRSLRDDKLPDFSQRPDRFKYQPWLDKPDIAPKDPSYFEHDDRGEDSEFGHRGSNRPFRGRGFRGRSFRGSIRGGIRSRGSFRGLSSNSSPRGRGYSSRRGRFSPGLWEHDMYEKMSPYHKPDDNRPITM